MAQSLMNKFPNEQKKTEKIENYFIESNRNQTDHTHKRESKFPNRNQIVFFLE